MSESVPPPSFRESVPPPSLRHHVPEIDGLRGIAIGLVLFNHSTQIFHDSTVDAHPFWGLSHGAWLGVDLFFVVSGYLITTILLSSRHHTSPFRTFWFRRALRIFPLAYFYLVLLVALGLARPRFHDLAYSSLPVWIATYAVNFRIALEGWTFPEVSHLWSLAIEEQFYLVWPFLVLALSVRRLQSVLLALLAVTPFVRWLTSESYGSDAVYVLTFTRWDGLAAGALIATALQGPFRSTFFVWSRRLFFPSLLIVAATFAVPLGVTSHHPTWFDVIGYSLITLALAVWTVRALDPSARFRRYLRLRPLTYAGTLCYGLYIWHPLVGRVVRQTLAGLGLGSMRELLVLVWIALTFATAAASYRWLEAPFLRLKAHFPAVASGSLGEETGGRTGRFLLFRLRRGHGSS
jgi:peptidoglycan/LPS O-acetylase OafA/YrhL